MYKAVIGIVLVALVAVGCGDDSPTRPTPPPPPPPPPSAPPPEPPPSRPSASTCVEIVAFNIEAEAEPGGDESAVILRYDIRNTCEDDVWTAERYEIRGTAPNTPTWEVRGTTSVGRNRANRTTRWRITVPFTGRHRVTDYELEATIRINSASYTARSLEAGQTALEKERM